MSDKSPTVPELLAQLAKKHSLKIGTFSEVASPTKGYSAANIGIDYVTGVGGLPQARMTELYGLPSSGKTTTALQSAAQLQKQIIKDRTDDLILYLDFEHALDLDYANDLGLNLEHPSFVLAQPNWLEQGAEIGLALIATGKVRMSIWDSVAAMTPKTLIDGEFDQRTSAMNRARLINGLCQRLVALIHEQDSAVVFINHLTEAIDMGGRPGMPAKATSPGGKGIKYYASLRLEFRQMGNVKADELSALTGQMSAQVSQTKVKVKCVKNKVGNPFREVEVLSRFGMGFDNAWSAIQVLVAHKKIVAAASGYFYFDHAKVPDLVHEHMDLSATKRPFIRGENNLLAFADAHPEWRFDLIGEASRIVNAFGAEAIDTSSQHDLDELGPDLELDEIIS